MLRELLRCPTEGPDALASRWARGPRSTDERDELVSVSGALRDARVFRAALTSASGGRAPDDRIGALSVLIRHYDPYYQASPRFLATGSPGAPIPRSPHASSVDGAQRLPGSAKREVGELLARIVASEGDPSVRRAALVLRQGL